MVNVYTSETKEITLHVVIDKIEKRTLEGHKDGIWVDIDQGTFQLIKRGEKLRLRLRIKGDDESE